LIEAVVNLVDNAVKFTPAGGRVEISLLRGNAKSIIPVKDTGAGINEPERDAVSKRLYRSEKLRNAPGFGLGLNLVAAIVKLHGLRLTIHPSSGCVVEIANPDHLPIARLASAAETAHGGSRFQPCVSTMLTAPKPDFNGDTAGCLLP
jgi:signal transduction histidine kinase